ncbi:fumarylacetoacetate hydrolase family protein [Alicyclobacillus fastidiosus]|uniref:Fumarylacetoacetate hydrolase family protein n=1 Tax=Alicyclobacillus fastidiosus TaxID=392011 RepID=A0ABY6ZNJ4_9BACL|nr:fumarylacetoacetate hydrolase family protein [Alicyclobacillus fastidiosus]WAH43664.1 fumarylacetoacetate hydrolase family protein [Alicyclobacillus fastidiosus]GMA59866.1 fumarylacetoacetate hydrolase [Alicyclobacillus fastidiosus]
MGEFRHWCSAEDSFQEIRNIFCVGRNYRDHASELGNAVPSEPMIFAKPTHALVAARGTVALPASRQEIHHELEIVLYIDKPVAPSSTARDVVGAVALGLDLTDRAAQTKLKEKGHPWEYAKGFVGSAILSDFYRFQDFRDVEGCHFAFDVNGVTVQSGNPRDMVFDFDALIQHVRRHFGLNRGDVLFTGTPAGVGPLRDGDQCVFQMNQETWAEFQIQHVFGGEGE